MSSGKSSCPHAFPSCFGRSSVSCLFPEPAGSGVTVPAVHGHCCSPFAISTAGDALQSKECEFEIPQTSPMASSVHGCGSC